MNIEKAYTKMSSIQFPPVDSNPELNEGLNIKSFEISNLNESKNSKARYCHKGLKLSNESQAKSSLPLISNIKARNKKFKNFSKFSALSLIVIFLSTINKLNFELVASKSVENHNPNSLIKTTEQEESNSNSHSKISDQEKEILNESFDQLNLTTKSPFNQELNKSTTKEESNTEETHNFENGNDQDNDSSIGDADYDAEDCKGLSADKSAEGQSISNHAKLVNLQSCLQRKVKQSLKSTARSAMILFEKISLSGSCSASLMSLVGALNELKSYAFKFFDASAKLPSGMMHGLLSDFGDFDQCLSIKSNPSVSIENEAEEFSYSGKYCLLDLKLKYHLDIEPNSTAPEGIISDGVFWDELVRNYWTAKKAKGFQIGVCVPSRCTNNDLDQLFHQIVSGYNIEIDLISCQDGHTLKAQHTPDLLQSVILHIIYALLLLTFSGTILDRYVKSNDFNKSETNFLNFAITTLKCFSLIKNWKIFINHEKYENKKNKNILRDINNFSHLDESHGISENTLSSQITDELYNSSISVDPSMSRIDKLGPLSIKIQTLDEQPINPLRCLSGIKLFILIWITLGHSFLYPSANNYQHYRSMVNMNITRDSVWFAATNFTLGIDMILYIIGLLFVVELVNIQNSSINLEDKLSSRLNFKSWSMIRVLLVKLVRFWPTYLAIIALTILVPLTSDGPMWPEMVVKRLGETCREHWLTNLLFINNLGSQSDVCLPSSWFISVIVQLLSIGSIIITFARHYSIRLALVIISFLLVLSSTASFVYALNYKVQAPVIRLDESFVFELDDNIFRLYTSIFNNLGPFLIGMTGGFILICSRIHITKFHQLNGQTPTSSQVPKRIIIRHIITFFMVATIALSVLSSVFRQNYTPQSSAVYWATHRIGWAIVTGYILHQCATGRWKLLNDFLSLSIFAPLSNLMFISYLVYPILIHIHSGVIRDGLHVSVYNMLNTYITRLVLTFVLAISIHLLVELPIGSIERIYIGNWLHWASDSSKIQMNQNKKSQPLLVVAPTLNNLAHEKGNEVKEDKTNSYNN